MPGAGALSARRKEDDVLSHQNGAVHAGTARKPVLTGLPQDQESTELLEIVRNSIEEDKAEDVVEIDLRGKSEIADWMVIASGRSSRQVAAIADKLVERVKNATGRTAKIEGKEASDWVLVDTGDVIVHVFRPEVREFYQLEKMWLDPATAPVRASDRT